MKPRVTAERLWQVLDYAPETGLFYWRVRSGRASPGKQAGTWSGKGYREIVIDNTSYRAHRLAWLHVTGEHPREEIDHRNGDRGDNSIANLRECSRAENNRNVATRSAAGFKGVDRRGSRWVAQINFNGKKFYLGIFASVEAAAEAYDQAARRYHGEFAKTNADMALLRDRSARGASQPPSLGPHRIGERREPAVVTQVFERDRQPAPPVGMLVDGARHVDLLDKAERVLHRDDDEPRRRCGEKARDREEIGAGAEEDQATAARAAG